MSNFVDTVKKGEELYDIHDKRVDNMSGGTKLYKHSFQLSKTAPNPGQPDLVLVITIISTSNTPITTISSKYGSYYISHDGELVRCISNNGADMIYLPKYAVDNSYLVKVLDIANSTFDNWLDSTTTISLADTVTAL